MDVNLTPLFNDFYHTRFFVVTCLAAFTLLFALRLDNTITCSYWLVFSPLWLWKFVALAGVLVGSVSWCRMSRRFERDTFIQYKAMLISFATNTMLFSFELIACEKLDAHKTTPWSICFIPLYALSLISIGSCIWSIRYDRSYEIELFCSLNILQFVFISLRLDNTITWSWVLVLIPVWILMSIMSIVLMYLIILTIIVTRSSHNLMHHHNNPGYRSKQKWVNVLLYSLLIFSLCAFEILIATKLDYEMPPSLYQPTYLPSPLGGGSGGPTGGFYITGINSQNNNHFGQLNKFSLLVLSSSSSSTARPFIIKNPITPSLSLMGSSSSSSTNLSYLLVSLPLYLVYFALLCLSFNNHSGNTLWFGLKMDFCDVFLNVCCPSCQTYGNVQLKLTKHELFPFLSRSGASNSAHQQPLSTSNPNTNSQTVTFSTERIQTKKKGKKKKGAAKLSIDTTHSNPASVMTAYGHMLVSNKPTEIDDCGSSTQNNNISLCDLADEGDNPSISMLNHVNAHFSGSSSIYSKKVTGGSRSLAAKSRATTMNDEVVELVEDQGDDELTNDKADEKSSKEKSNTAIKSSEYSLRSFNSNTNNQNNSDHLSIKSCNLKSSFTNSSTKPLYHQSAVIMNLEMPD